MELICEIKANFFLHCFVGEMFLVFHVFDGSMQRNEEVFDLGSG